MHIFYLTFVPLFCILPQAILICYTFKYLTCKILLKFQYLNKEVTTCITIYIFCNDMIEKPHDHKERHKKLVYMSTFEYQIYSKATKEYHK